MALAAGEQLSGGKVVDADGHEVLVVGGGTIPATVLPASVVTDSQGASAPLKDQGGTALVNNPAWQANTPYPSGYVVQQNGTLYAAQSTFTSAATWALDADNWAPLPISPISSGIKAGNVTCAHGATTNVLTLPCPALIPGSGSTRIANASSMLIIGSLQPNPAPAGTTQITPSVDQTDNAGAFIGNLAFWPITNFATGEISLFSFSWVWMPRSPTHLGDVDLGNGAGKYISLRVAVTGSADMVVAASHLALMAGPFPQPTVGDTW